MAAPPPPPTSSSSAAAASSDPAAAAPPPAASPTPPPPRPPYLIPVSSPLLPLPSPFSQSILGRPPNPPPGGPPRGFLIPVGPGPRGYPPRPGPRAHAGDHHVVTVANPAGYIRNNSPTAMSTFPASAVQGRPLGYPSDHAAQVYHHHHQQRLQRQQQGSVHQVRPPQQPQAQQSCPQFVIPRPVGVGGASASLGPDSAPPAAVAAASAPPSKVVPVAAGLPKVASFQAVTLNPEFSNFKDLRDKSRDEGVLLVNSRKARLLESPSGSLYALCRSWVRNGLSQEIQPNFGDGIRLLPRPLPLKVAEPASVEKSAVDAEGDDPGREENADSVDKLSADDLLQRHIKRAKRVRACLREERLKRIERYKQRLSLLLPLPVEQCRSDAAPES